MKKQTYKGKYVLKNPDKYIGDKRNIVYRSLWERRIMVWLDTHPSILKWASEPFGIPYVKPIDNQIHRYFPDFWIQARTASGVLQESLIEIKPHRETVMPERPKDNRGKRAYLEEMCTYAINQAKWASAKKLCEKRNWQFKVWTERVIPFK